MAHSDRSEVLVDFAAPFLPLGQRRPAPPVEPGVQWILDLAGVVWDLTEAGFGAPQILEALGPVSPEAVVMVDALVRRKRVVFAHDRRLALGSA